MRLTNMSSMNDSELIDEFESYITFELYYRLFFFGLSKSIHYVTVI